MRVMLSNAAALGLVVCVLIAVPAAQLPSVPSTLGDGPWELDTADYRIRVTRVADLEYPMGMAFLPDGSILVTERVGRLRIIRKGVLDPKPISGVPEVLPWSKAFFDGLYDVTLHPRFAENRLVYLSYTKPTKESTGECAVARGRYDGGSELRDVKDIFVGHGVTGGGIGTMSMVKLAWGKDGTLYVTCATPNGVAHFQSQEPSSHRGKVLRLKDDGTVPPDNPLIGKSMAGRPFRPEIFTIGMRDGFGITVHPETGEVWEVENGPQGGDELNVLRPGANYGWPLVAFGNEYTGVPYDRYLEGTEQPYHVWRPNIAPSSIIFYTGDKFPKWKMNALVSGMAGRRLDRFAFDKNHAPISVSDGADAEPLLFELRQRLRQVRQSPDGLLYVITDYRNGALLRIEPIAGRTAPADAALSTLDAGPWEFQSSYYRIRVTKTVDKLEYPYSMAWLPDGTMLVTERPGRLRIVRNGVLDPQPISGVPPVFYKDSDGLLDVAPHPQYAQNKLIYFTYSKSRDIEGAGGQCALGRARYDGGYALTDFTELFVGIRANPAFVTQQASARLAWGADGALYMTCATPPENPFEAQDPSKHGGKVLRFRDDGKPAPDNPLINTTAYGQRYRPEIYTTGHAPGAIARQPDTGEIWEVESVPGGGDELNRLEAGQNYGWPLISMGRPNGVRMLATRSDRPQLRQPFLFWSPSLDPSSVTFYTGERFQGWKGSVLVSGVSGARIERLEFQQLDFQENAIVPRLVRIPQSTHMNADYLLTELRQRIRQVQQGPDELIYALTDYRNGALLRIEPAGTMQTATH